MVKNENKSILIEKGDTSVHIYEDENSILNFIIKGAMDEETALKIKKFVYGFFETQPSKVNELVDLNEAGKNSPEARDIFKEMGEHEKIGKIAFVGLHPVARILASFVTNRITGNKDMKFFSHKEDALKWLKS